jgi:Dimerisation domain
MTNVAPDLIFHIASGFMAAKHLFVANEIGIFEHLGAGSATLEELARRVESSRDPCESLSMPWSLWASSSGSRTVTATHLLRRFI